MAPTPGTFDTALFADRRDAGRQLAARLDGFRPRKPVIVGMAPDGMPVAAEVADALGAPLEAVAVQPLKLGENGRERFGTAAEGGITFFERDHIQAVEDQPEAVDAAIIDAQKQLERHAKAWHGNAGRPSLSKREVLLVTDVLLDVELAAAAACEVRDRGAASVTFAAPLVRMVAASALVDWVDEIVCLKTIHENLSPEACFDQHASPTDEEIHQLLEQNALARRRTARVQQQHV